MKKTCGQCKIEKSLDSFHKGNGKYNTSSTCKECHKVYTHNHYLKNKQKYIESAKQHQIDNKTHKQEYDRKRRTEKKEELKAYKKFVYQRDKEKINARTKQWVLKNLERRKEIARKWSRDNPDYVRIRSYLRTKQIDLATPKWLTKEQLVWIKFFYSLAVKISEDRGTPFQVDHIYPIKGKNSCGLNVPWNLQILTAEQNMKKGNKLPDEI